MDYPPRNGQGDRRPARPWQDPPGRGQARRVPPSGRPPRENAEYGAPRDPRKAPPRRPGPPPERRPARRVRRNSFRGAKIALTVVSLLVMGLTGYAWASFQGLVNGLNYADVIDPKSGGDQPPTVPATSSWSASTAGPTRRATRSPRNCSTSCARASPTAS